MANGPLHGIRVLEFSHIYAGPYAGMHLSDLGADVIKIEPPLGEAFRHTGSVVPGTSKAFQWLNRGKRSLVLNLADERAQEIVHRMVPQADVVLINYRPGVPARLRIDYDFPVVYPPGPSLHGHHRLRAAGSMGGRGGLRPGGAGVLRRDGERREGRRVRRARHDPLAGGGRPRDGAGVGDGRLRGRCTTAT